MYICLRRPLPFFEQRDLCLAQRVFYCDDDSVYVIWVSVDHPEALPVEGLQRAVMPFDMIHIAPIDPYSSKVTRMSALDLRGTRTLNLHPSYFEVTVLFLNAMPCIRRHASGRRDFIHQPKNASRDRSSPVLCSFPSSVQIPNSDGIFVVLSCSAMFAVSYLHSLPHS